MDRNILNGMEDTKHWRYKAGGRPWLKYRKSPSGIGPVKAHENRTFHLMAWTLVIGSLLKVFNRNIKGLSITKGAFNNQQGFQQPKEP